MNKYKEFIDKIIPDPYDRQARLYPVLILLFPLLLTFWTIVPEKKCNWEVITGLTVWCGLAYLLKEMGRDCGKKKEKALWDKWGGVPTTQYLRHSGSTNKITLKRVHEHLQLIIPNLTIPSKEYEILNPDESDNVYEECTRVIIQKTRDTGKYPLIFKELCSYGFWRNLWGLKLWGIIVSSFCIVIISTATYVEWRKEHILSSYNSIICDIIIIGIFFLWLIVTQDRIYMRATAYSKRLFEATESLVEEI